jgi:hypothetical protein
MKKIVNPYSCFKIFTIEIEYQAWVNERDAGLDFFRSTIQFIKKINWRLFQTTNQGCPWRNLPATKFSIIFMDSIGKQTSWKIAQSSKFTFLYAHELGFYVCTVKKISIKKNSSEKSLKILPIWTKIKSSWPLIVYSTNLLNVFSKKRMRSSVEGVSCRKQVLTSVIQRFLSSKFFKN